MDTKYIKMKPKRKQKKLNKLFDSTDVAIVFEAYFIHFAVKQTTHFPIYVHVLALINTAFEL